MENAKMQFYAKLPNDGFIVRTWRDVSANVAGCV